MGRSNTSKTGLKAKELAEELLKHPEFDVEFGLLDKDGSKWGVKCRRFDVMVDDIGYSEKVFVLGASREINT